MKFKLELKIKGVDKVFKEGMNPGVFIDQEVDYKSVTELTPLFIAHLLDADDEFMKEHVEVIRTEIKDEE
jgi:hypothetical protein